MSASELNMALHERQANSDFAGRRVPVPGRAPKNDIRDVNICSIRSNGCHHFIQELATHTDKGRALAVLISAWRFADEHDLGIRISVREYGVGGSLFKWDSCQTS